MSYSRAKGIPTKPPPGSFADPTHPLSRGLVGWWLFNEGAGSRLADVSGLGNHGALTNFDLPAAWTGSLHGGALDFDGSNDYVITDSISFSSGSVSFFAWAKFAAIDGTQNIVLDGFDFGIRLEVAASNVLRVHIGNGSSFFILSLTGPALVANRWYHLGATFDSATARLYLDGVEVNSTTGSGTPTIGTLNIGRYGGSGFGFPGLVDDARIYNRALSADEVWQLYEDPYGNLIAVPARRYFLAAATVFTLDLDGGAYSHSGAAVALEAGRVADLDGGSYALAGANLSTEFARLADLDGGAYVLSGADITLSFGFVLDLSGAAYILTGGDVGLEFSRVADLDGDSYALAGADVALEFARLADLDGGAYLQTGGDVALEFARVADLDGGSYLLTGGELALVLGFILDLEGGSYALAGSDAALELARVVDMDASTYALSGAALALEHGFVAPLDGGSYVLTGAGLSLLLDRVADFGGGSYLQTGATLELDLAGGPNTDGAIVISRAATIDIAVAAAGRDVVAGRAVEPDPIRGRSRRT